MHREGIRGCLLDCSLELCTLHDTIISENMVEGQGSITVKKTEL